MPVFHQWDNEEKTIYIFVMHEHWEWVEYLESLREGYEEIRAVDQQVDIVYAFISDLPEEGDPVQYLMMTSENQPKNCHRTVVVDSVQDSLQEMIAAIDTMRNWIGPRFVVSLDDAREFLVSQDN